MGLALTVSELSAFKIQPQIRAKRETPSPWIVQVATTPVPEPELTVEVGDCPITGHLEDVLYSVDDYYTVTRYSPSRPVYRPRVMTNNQPSILNKSLTLTPGSLAFFYIISTETCRWRWRVPQVESRTAAPAGGVHFCCWLPEVIL